MVPHCEKLRDVQINRYNGMNTSSFYSTSNRATKTTSFAGRRKTHDEFFRNNGGTSAREFNSSSSSPTVVKKPTLTNFFKAIGQKRLPEKRPAEGCSPSKSTKKSPQSTLNSRQGSLSPEDCRLLAGKIAKTPPFPLKKSYSDTGKKRTTFNQRSYSQSYSNPTISGAQKRTFNYGTPIVRQKNLSKDFDAVCNNKPSSVDQGKNVTITTQVSPVSSSPRNPFASCNSAQRDETPKKRRLSSFVQIPSPILSDSTSRRIEFEPKATEKEENKENVEKSPPNSQGTDKETVDLAAPEPEPDLIFRDPEDPLPLKNLGNTCYMNSIVQSLFALQPFLNFLNEQFNAVKTSESGSHFLMTPSLLNLHNEYSTRKLQCTTTLEDMDDQLTKLKTCVGEKSFEFKSYNQQDAVEFLELILGSIDEEFDRTDLDVEVNPVKKYFQIECDSHLKCTTCSNVQAMPKQHSHALYLCIPKTSESVPEVTLQQAVDNFFVEEKIDYKCEAKDCGSTERMKSTSITRLPEILFLQLGRYSEDGTKLHDPISVPPEITVPFKPQLSKENLVNGSENQPESSQLLQKKYKLVAAISHYGTTRQGGHYTSYVFQAENKAWYFCDDDSVSKSSFEDAQEGLKTSGYCFFYVDADQC